MNQKYAYTVCKLLKAFLCRPMFTYLKKKKKTVILRFFIVIILASSELQS